MTNEDKYPKGPDKILTYEEVQKINPRLWEKDWCQNLVLSDAAKKRQEESAKKIKEYYKRRNGGSKDNNSK